MENRRLAGKCLRFYYLIGAQENDSEIRVVWRARVLEYMVHIRIINSRKYYYTSKWNPITKRVDNIYLGAVEPIRKRVTRRKLSASDVLSKAKATAEENVKAAIEKAKLIESR